METILEVDNISKIYPNNEKDFHALDNVSLTIQTGDIYGIIGLSGAGKSTLIRTLSQLVVPTTGKILFRGIDINAMEKQNLRAFRKKIGMIFQHFNLLSSRSVADNIAYPLEIANMQKKQRDMRVEELLGFVGLKERKDLYPAQLSGGEKQRVGIARALANSPDILLCDEATSALDPKTTKEILALLKGVNKDLGVTIVLITHEMEVIKQVCNKVAVIERGRIIEKGPVAEVFADPQHAVTKSILQKTIHDIPLDLLKNAIDNRKLLRLIFKGKAVDEPIISEIVRKFDVDINIMMGWIDRLQTLTIGTMIIELNGSPLGIKGALEYLQEKAVHFEVIENGLG